MPGGGVTPSSSAPIAMGASVGSFKVGSNIGAFSGSIARSLARQRCVGAEGRIGSGLLLPAECSAAAAVGPWLAEALTCLLPLVLVAAGWARRPRASMCPKRIDAQDGDALRKLANLMSPRRSSYKMWV